MVLQGRMPDSSAMKPQGCLFPECTHKGDSFCRGLCINHYRTANRTIDAGETTWRALEQSGKALKSTKKNQSQVYREATRTAEVMQDILEEIARAARLGTIIAKGEYARKLLRLAETN